MIRDNLPDSQVGFLTSHLTQSFLTELVTLGGPVLGTQVSLSFALGSIRDGRDPSLLLVAGRIMYFGKTLKNRNLQGSVFFIS